MPFSLSVSFSRSFSSSSNKLEQEEACSSNGQSVGRLMRRISRRPSGSTAFGFTSGTVEAMGASQEGAQCAEDAVLTCQVGSRHGGLYTFESRCLPALHVRGGDEREQLPEAEGDKRQPEGGFEIMAAHASRGQDGFQDTLGGEQAEKGGLRKLADVSTCKEYS